jgi:hypothetical protein
MGKNLARPHLNKLSVVTHARDSVVVVWSLECCSSCQELYLLKSKSDSHRQRGDQKSRVLFKRGKGVENSHMYGRGFRKAEPLRLFV